MGSSKAAPGDIGLVAAIIGKGGFILLISALPTARAVDLRIKSTVSR